MNEARISRDPQEIVRNIRGQESSDEKLDKLEDARMEEVFTFTVSYEDHRGRVFEGEFSNKILSLNDKSVLGATRAQLNGGMPSNAIDDYTATLNQAIAHLEVSLQKRPPWFNLATLKDEGLLAAVYKEVTAHERIFWGREPDQEDGAAEIRDGGGGPA